MGDGEPVPGALVGFTADLTAWAYTPINKWKIDKGRHQIPAVYNGLPLLAFAGDVSREYAMHWDMDYTGSSTFDPSVEINQNNLIAKNLRHSLSLNTCQGCHSGENKTFFTHIAPLGYGQEAKYWDAVPSTRSGFLDVRNDPSSTQVVQARNIGETLKEPILKQYAPNHPVPSTTRLLPNVSAFITGRDYNGSNTKPYADDSEDLTKDLLPDEDHNGLYFVNDPSNVRNNTQHDNFGNNDKQRGFNELVNRRKIMCMFLEAGCEPKVTFDVLDFMRMVRVHPYVE